MKILVLGRNGQLAKSLFFIKDDYNVEVFFVGNPEFNPLNPYNLHNIITKIEPNLIINTQAYTDVLGAENDFNNAKIINCNTVNYIGNICNEFEIPLIHISTDYVFDGLKKSPYLENDLKNPLNAYGMSKSMGEDALLKYSDNVIILRTSWLYSQFGDNFVKKILARTNNGSTSLDIVCDQYGSPTNAIDLARIIYKISIEIHNSRNKDLFGIFHVCGNGATNWAHFAKYFINKSLQYGFNDCNINYLKNDNMQPVMRPKYSVLNCDKLKLIYGLKMDNWEKSIDNSIYNIIKEIGKK